VVEIFKNTLSSLYTFDIVYLVFTLLSLIKCTKNGFVLSILSASKWLLAYVITLFLFPKAKPYLKDIIDSEYVLDLVVGIGLYVIVIFLILLMFLILFTNIKISHIGIVPNFIAAFFFLGIISMS